MNRTSHRPVRRSSSRLFRTLGTALLVASLLLGLIPPPLVTSIAPAPLEPVADAVTDLLPAPSVAAAAPALAPVVQAACGAGGDISGTVFRDYNADGQQSVGNTEPGLGGIVVTVHDSDGGSTACTSNADGSYSITSVGAYPVRVEFTLPTDGSLNYLQPGAAGETTVQFLNAASTGVNAGFNNPSDYCENNPQLATGCYVYGHQIDGDNSTRDALVSVAYDATGESPTLLHLAKASDIGTTWGIAHHRESQTIYAAAFMKRHTGFGPSGPGAIYQINPGPDGTWETADDSISTLVTLAAGTDPHPVTAAGDWFHDAASFDEVGKMGLGDIDIAADGSTLYAINLFDRRLYSIPLSVDDPPVAGTPTSVDLPIPANCPVDPATPGGEMNLNVRPFALRVNAGQIYIGMVCTAQSTGLQSDLRAYVYQYDGVTFAQVLNFPLDYSRGSDLGVSLEWRVWTNDFFATVPLPADPTYRFGTQPWLTDIEFDGEDMIIGFRDRTGDQLGRFAGSTDINSGAQYNGLAYGDTLRACADGSGGWTLESNGTCGAITTASANNNLGPDGGEYYADVGAHNNSTSGALALLSGSGEVAATQMDVIGGVNTGIAWLSNSTGVRTDWVKIVDGGIPNQQLGKANGLGDLEAICTAAPIEIGNRVWLDEDGDGIQDPDESAISSVTVTLHDMDNGGAQVGSTTADANGNYYFGGLSDTNMTSGPLLTNRSYKVRISLADAALPISTLTTQNANGVTDNESKTDLTDSDASASGGSAVIAFTTGSAGENNHTLDFGFGTSTDGTITIVKNTVGGDATFDFSSTDADLAAVSLTTVSNTASSSVIAKTAGTYTITEDALTGWSLTGIIFSGDTDSGSSSAGSAATIDLDAGENITVTFTNELVPASLGIQKTRTVPASGLANEGDSVTFSLTISNTGQVTVTELSLIDTFDANYLTFSSASITPDTPGAGTLSWVGTNDGITPGIGSLQNELPLGPGEQFVITVEFTATKP